FRKVARVGWKRSLAGTGLSTPFCEDFGSFVERGREAGRFDEIVPKCASIPRVLKGNADPFSGNAPFGPFSSHKRPRRIEKLSEKNLASPTDCDKLSLPAPLYWVAHEAQRSVGRNA